MRRDRKRHRQLKFSTNDLQHKPIRTWKRAENITETFEYADPRKGVTR